MPSRTTSCAPPEVAPETMRTASPFDCANALMAGLGPMNVASIAPPNSASTAAGPALKIWVVSFVSPSASWKVPSSTPTRATACVRLAK